MTGIIVAAVIIGLITLVGGAVLFLLLPMLLAAVGALALVAVMAVVAVLMIPNFVTLDDFKPQIINMLKQTTGREIAIGGPIGFSVWPVLGLQLKDISVGNPAGAEDPIMLAAQEVGVGVTLSSLMDHRLELRELRIVGGQLNLSVNSRGQGNWVLKPEQGSTQAAESKPAESTEATASEQPEQRFSIKDVQIEKIEIVDTNISYDTPTGDPVDLDDIDITFSMPSLDQPLSLQGDVTLRNMEVKVSGTVDKPRALMAQEDTPVNLTISLGGDEVKLTGTAKSASFKGDVAASVGNLGKLASWASATPANVPFGKLGLTARLDASAERVALNNLNLKLDDTTVTGSIVTHLNGARPRLVADVDVTPLNLDALAGTEPASARAPASSGAAAPETEPDLSTLDKLNAEVTARLQGLVYKGAQLGATTAKVNLSGGRLQASLTPASLYEGTLAAKADVSAATPGGGRSFSANVVLDGVQISPVLQQFAGSDRLSGKGDLVLNVTGPVGTSSAIKRGLNGDGRFMFRDGALKGVNIAGLLRRAKSVLSGQAAANESGPVQTDFTELSGTLGIANGVVSNTDLKMLSPLVRVTGKGTISLPQDSADYRIEAALVADLTGQGGVMERRGLVVPINVRGPLANLRYEPDLQGLLLGNVDAARDIGNAVQGLGTKEGQRNTREAIKGLLGLPGRQPSAEPQTQPTTDPSAADGTSGTETPTPTPAPAPAAPPKPQDVLRNLLNR